MKDWTDGYVADVNYDYSFFSELAPINIVFNLLDQGFYPPSLENFTYCELGCGHGFTTNVLAASYPTGKFWAIDFNPSHAAEAQRLAEEATLDNITILDASFEEFLTLDTPQFDFIVLHGVYSWISRENRLWVVDILKNKLKFGGAVYISYNTLPGWSALMPLRELMVQYTHQSGDSTIQKVNTAIDYAKKLQALKASYFLDNTTVKSELEDIEQDSRNYLAHEFFNRDWHPLYHFEVAQELADAKLTFATSADLDKQFETMHLHEHQANLLTEIDDLTLKETVRDFFFNTRFRRDIFVKGPIQLKSLEQVELLSQITFILLVDPTDVTYRVVLAGRQIALNQTLYSSIISALARQPQSLRSLIQDESLKTIDFSSIFQALKILMVMNCVAVCLSNEIKLTPQHPVRQLNSAILRRARMGDETPVLASSVVGNGVTISRAEQLLLLAHNRKVNPVQFIWNIMKVQGEKLIKEGEVLEDEKSNQAEIKRQADQFEEIRFPIMQRLGLVD